MPTLAQLTSIFHGRARAWRMKGAVEAFVAVNAVCFVGLLFVLNSHELFLTSEGGGGGGDGGGDGNGEAPGGGGDEARAHW